MTTADRHEAPPDLPRRPLGRVARSAGHRQPGRTPTAGRRDVQRHRRAVRGGGRGGRRGVRGDPRRCPPTSAAAILREISAGIKARREELGRLIALEAGKPIRDALVEVDRAVLTFRLGAEEAERMVGETIPLDLMPASKGRVGITRRFPIGPIAGDQPVQLPAEPRRPQGRAGDRRRATRSCSSRRRRTR